MRMAYILGVAFECIVVCVGVTLLGCSLCWAKLVVDTPVGLAWGQALGVWTCKAAGCVSRLNEQKKMVQRLPTSLLPAVVTTWKCEPMAQ